MESISLIQYKWSMGVYQLKDMVDLVNNKIIDEETFFDITRKKFKEVVKTRKL